MAAVAKMQRAVFSSFVLALLVVVGFYQAPSGQTASVNVTTQHNDNNRTGANVNETALSTANVNVLQFGKLFSRTVDGQIYAQPLYVSNLNMGAKGVHNVLFVATEKNNLYAFDADDPIAATPLWQVNFGTPVPVKSTGELLDINEYVGITSTPVIDLASRTLYCVAKTKQGNAYPQKLHALDLVTGQEKFGAPITIQGSVSGSGDGAKNGAISFNSLRHLNRPALLLHGGYLFVAFGSHGDVRPYHGWVFSYNATTLQQVAIFNTTPGTWGGATWQSGQGLAADASGVYFMTANGHFDGDIGGTNFSSSFLKLGAPTLSLLDWFAPFNADTLDASNEDLASAGPMLLPGTNLLVGGGKEGVLYLLDRTNMGHFRAGNNAQIVQSFQAADGHIHGSPVYWNSTQYGPLVYMWSENDVLKAYRFVNGLLQTSPFGLGPISAPDGMPGGILSVSAAGGTSGTGIVWASMPYTGDANLQTVPGVLRAFDASNVAVELWNSRQNESRDDFGNFAKYTPPTIANGKVYVATFSNRLAVYGLLPSVPNPAPVVSDVSPTSGATSGGTDVSITGANFAGGAAVTFGGVPATNVTVLSTTTITARTPLHSAGSVDVVVANPDNYTGTLPAGFTYTDTSPTAPIVSGVSPNSGPISGGTVVTITGSNFASGGTVTFGGVSATNVIVVSASSITATTPPHAAGAVTVSVSNPSSEVGALAAGFTYSPGVVSFIQVAAATPQSSPTTVSVSYTSPQTVGDLNIVVVGWNNSTSVVQSITDSAGNAYSLAIGPTTGTSLRQSIYYAKSIIGGPNTVSVIFNQATAYPDIRILEYRGVTTLDVTAGASGNSNVSSSGSATTTSPNELIFGANTVWTLTSGAGSGFMSRIVTSPDGDIAEDRVVSAPGSYSATAPLTSAGPWVMQMVTFK
jgi:hypothetical protein